MTKTDIIRKQAIEKEKWSTNGISGRVTALDSTAGEITVAHGGFGVELSSKIETSGNINPRKFLRIHRSVIVNLDFVRELQPMFRGEYKVLMRDGTELKLSHNYRDNLRQNLGGNL